MDIFIKERFETLYFLVTARTPEFSTIQEDFDPMYSSYRR